MKHPNKLGASVIGWREWVGLPDLGIARVKAKVDTGARSSSLHAFDIETFVRNNKEFVRFRVHPLQRNSTKTVRCEARVLGSRKVRSSTGHAQRRIVIVTTIAVLGATWPIELTLANRDAMGFRMLVGRQGIRGRFLVDSGRSYYGGQMKKKKKKVKRRTLD